MMPLGLDEALLAEYGESAVQLVLVDEPPETVYKNTTYHLQAALVSSDDKLVPFPFFLPDDSGRMIEYDSLTVRAQLLYHDNSPVPSKRTVSVDDATGAPTTKELPPLRASEGIMRDGVANVALGVNALSGRGKSLILYKLKIYVEEAPQLCLHTDTFIVRSKPPTKSKTRSGKTPKTSPKAVLSAKRTKTSASPPGQPMAWAMASSPHTSQVRL